MHLWLLRHGDALHPSGTSDEGRPLSPLGKHQARRIGSFLSRRTVPRIILSSRYLRAHQTSSIVASHCSSVTIEVADELRSGAHQEDLFHLLRTRKEQSILLVGHEPLISSFTSSLVAGHASSVLRFSPCTLALVRYSGTARPNSATLDILIPPEVLMRSRPKDSET